MPSGFARTFVLFALAGTLLPAAGCGGFPFRSRVNPAAVRSLHNSIHQELDRLTKEFDKLDRKGDVELCAPSRFAVARFAVYQAVEERRSADMAQLTRFMIRARMMLGYAKERMDQRRCVDNDGDGLTDLVEVRRYKTRPDNTDTDHDKLPDGLEVRRYRTDPLRADTDKDLLVDGEEVLRRLSPRHPDSDGDGYTDGLEVAFGSDPRDTCSQPAEGERLKGPWTKCASGEIVRVTRKKKARGSRLIRKPAAILKAVAPRQKKTATAPAPKLKPAAAAASGAAGDSETQKPNPLLRRPARRTPFEP